MLETELITKTPTRKIENKASHLDDIHSIIFIDPRVPDHEVLIGGARPGHRVLLLDTNADGLRQIAEALAIHGRPKLSAVNIVSHGMPGQLQLGATLLNERGLKSHVALLSEIGASLAPGGDILLYACDVARGVAGRQFVEELSVCTGANVAAASHPVGAAERGEAGASTSAPARSRPICRSVRRRLRDTKGCWLHP